MKGAARRLGLKLFFSYLMVIAVGVVVLAVAAEFSVPGAFDRHLAAMQQMMSSSMMMGGDLFANFRLAVREALFLAASAALLAAILVSAFVTRQVVTPIQQMTAASQRIAQGHYDERVAVAGRPEDFDELDELAVSFNRMATELEQTETMRRQLIADVSHELRTPLTTIKGTAEALIDGVLPPEAETYQRLYREAARLQRLVEDLQELSRVEAQAYELHRRPLRLGSTIAATVERLERQFEEKNVALRVTAAPDLPPVLADEMRIEQVLLNLLGNALQYTPRGGRVHVTAHVEDGYVVTRIADSGIGIAVEHLPHLFTRFYRVDKSRSRAGGGSGIGLTIARSLVEAHGGTIRAESGGPGQGSVFTFTLPVAPGDL